MGRRERTEEMSKANSGERRKRFGGYGKKVERDGKIRIKGKSREGNGTERMRREKQSNGRK